ncbi:unnamed protein product [Clavelina lepadiformis]|uniref:Uncharacterized protein n=1 Tax=Clavelina lepadiformis TaxID=159417 RepID=A0ABP0GUW0_CLALP
MSDVTRCVMLGFCTVLSSLGSTFVLYGEDYDCANIYNGIYIYQSPTKTLAYGVVPRFILILRFDSNDN